MKGKKICMIGMYGVGKTSLVRRFLTDSFDERYLTTIGVKVDKKDVTVDGDLVTLSIWDVAGEDAMAQVKLSHLRGAHGYLLVADGLRRASLEKADELKKRIAEQLHAELPFALLINKADLRDQWEVQRTEVQAHRDAGWECYETSALHGDHVEAAFQSLARRMLAQDAHLKPDDDDDDE
jgi:small GTP-binding protein